MGDARRAIEYYEQDLAIEREIRDTRGEAIASFKLAIAVATQGELDQALQYAQEAVRLFEQMGHEQYAERAKQLVAKLQS